MNQIGQAPFQEDEEDTDYDIFASVRPKGISVDDNPEDEADGESVDNFSQFRPKEDEINTTRKEKEAKKNPSLVTSAKDYAKQAIKETLIGAGGTWGDLAELAGVNPKSSDASKNRSKREFDALERMQQPGNKTSFTDLEDVAGEQDYPINNIGLPTSKDLSELNDLVGGPGEPETAAGRYGKRQGKLYGAGLAFGQANPIPALTAGIAGQTAEEVGVGPLGQTALEIATLILTPAGGAKRLAASTKEEIRNKVNDLRRLGYTEEEITLAINHASKGKKGGISASKGSKTEQAFEDFAEHSDQMVSDILTSEIHGIERGTQYVHEMAANAYGEVARQAAALNIKDSTPFINAATQVVREIRKNLGRNPESEAFAYRLAHAVIDSTQNPSAENFMNFYKELNKAGNWMSRSQKDRLLTQMKNGIKDTFRSEGPAGRRLAENFEQANAGIRRAYQAEEVHGIVQKAMTQDGIDYKKLYKQFDNPENVHLMEDVLGATQTRNLNLIAKTGKEVKDFDKAWKATHLFQGNKALDIATGAGAGYYLYKGDMEGLATVLATKGIRTGAKKISEKLLTDPKFQNLMIRGVHALSVESPKAFKSANEAMQKYLDKEGIDVKLD